MTRLDGVIRRYVDANTGHGCGLQPAGSTNLDITLSADGAYLYSLNAGVGILDLRVR
jgi:hypothetical protein